MIAAGSSKRLSPDLLALESDSRYLAFSSKPGLPRLLSHAKEFAPGRKWELYQNLAEMHQLINRPARTSSPAPAELLGTEQ